MNEKRPSVKCERLASFLLSDRLGWRALPRLNPISPYENAARPVNPIRLPRVGHQPFAVYQINHDSGKHIALIEPERKPGATAEVHGRSCHAIPGQVRKPPDQEQTASFKCRQQAQAGKGHATDAYDHDCLSDRHDSLRLTLADCLSLTNLTAWVKAVLF